MILRLCLGKSQVSGKTVFKLTKWDIYISFLKCYYLKVLYLNLTIDNYISVYIINAFKGLSFE